VKSIPVEGCYENCFEEEQKDKAHAETKLSVIGLSLHNPAH
jgi:hypothetical protein